MQEENGMTVKQFVDILKKSWVTILVSVLIVAIVFGSFLAIVKTVATDSYYRGTLYFAGSDSNDNRATDISGIVSADNISKALRAAGYSEDEIAGLTETVRGAMTVTPVVPAGAQGSDTEYVPSTYTVTMNPIDGLTESECISVVNAVMNQFVNDYAQSDGAVGSSLVMVTSDYDSYDYIHIAGELIDITTNNMEVVSDVVSRTSAASDSSQNAVFSAIQARLESELARLRTLQSSIAYNGTTKEDPALSNEQYLDQAVTSAQAKVTALESEIESYETLLSQLAAGGSTGGVDTGSGSIIIDNSALYNFLNQNYSRTLGELTEAREALALVQQVQTVYGEATAFENADADTKAAMRQSAETQLNAAIENLNSLFEELRTLLNDYNGYTGSSTKSISVLAPASLITESVLGTTTMLLVLVIVVVLTVFFAFMHGRKKYMLALEAAKDREDPSDGTPTDGNGGDATEETTAEPENA